MSMILPADQVFKPVAGSPDLLDLVIPQELCDQLGWEPGQELSIKVRDGQIIVSKTVAKSAAAQVNQQSC